MDTFLTTAYAVTDGVPWWAWVALLTMLFWGLLVPTPGDD